MAMTDDCDFERFERVGGHPALDFVNTAHCWEKGRPRGEYLTDYEALANWHAATGLLDAPALRALAAGSPTAKRKAWQQAIRMRATLYRLFAALAAARAVPQEDLDALQRILARTASWRRLSAEGRSIVAAWNFMADFNGDFTGNVRDAPPAAILGPVAWSAAELLERGPLERIKACPPRDGCGWLFLDLSKNRSRTWCSMKTCGNAAKVRRFRARAHTL